MRQLRYLRLLEVAVVVHKTRLIRHPLRAVPRTPQAPLVGHIANYNPRHGRNPYQQLVLVERRARGPAELPADPAPHRARPGRCVGWPPARCSTSTGCRYGLHPLQGL